MFGFFLSLLTINESEKALNSNLFLIGETSKIQTIEITDVKFDFQIIVVEN